MHTIVFDMRKGLNSKIKDAGKIIKNGGLVALPTETVYGLGANALNQNAVKKIFIAKGRPSDNPLIVHIADLNELKLLVKEVPEKAKRLMKRFWPGPLTLIMKKTKIVPKITTGGLESVAIRMPSHKIALSLIKHSNVPIAAPSANLFGKPSPTSADHVILDLFGKIDAIIDGGNASIGVESTVIDMTSEPPILFRPGKVTVEQIEKCIGKIIVHPSVSGIKMKNVIAKSPGMKYKHYAPNAKVIVVEGKNVDVKKKIKNLVKEYNRLGKGVGVITTDKNHDYDGKVIFIGKNQNAFAKNLFKTFREFDKTDVDIIIAESIELKGLGLAIMNRLRRASFKEIKAK
jgi:L-threonylcarbamoyladenylate synthase